MIGETFADEIDCGSFFDHIGDLPDFPAGDLDDGAFAAISDSNSAFPPIWSTHPDSLTAAGDPDPGLSAVLSVPYEDIVQLEWLSNFVEDSFSGACAGALTVDTSSISPPSSAPNQFQTSSPVSVLDSSSSSSSSDSGEKKAIAAGKRGRPRSKRPRPPAFVPRPPQLVSPTTSEAGTGKVSSDSENFAESCSPPPPKKKRIKVSFLRRDPANRNDALSPGVRKCLHCEVTKTPQWRAGPLGPKTLCNACGVRFKSGRLFPEYRPAASPTFVPCLHSNSHKKVIEMRTKQDGKSAKSPAEETPELIPNMNSGIVLDFV